MLRLFKSNDPYLLIVVFVVLLIIRLIGWIYGFPYSEFELKWMLVGERLANGFDMYSETYDFTAPLSALTYKLLHFIGGRGRVLPQVLGMIFIIVQAGILNSILLRNKAFDDNNYLPSLFYVLLATAIADSAVLSPVLMSMTFILLALNNIFRRIDNEVKDELFLYAGLYLGVAALFYLPAAAFFIIFLLSLLLFSSPALRRLLLFFYGLLLPYLICLGIYYTSDQHWDFMDSYFRGWFNATAIATSWSLLLKNISGAFAMLAFLIIAVMVRLRLTNYQEKILQVMLLLVVGAAMAVWADVDLGVHQMILLVPTLSFFLTHYISTLSRRFWKLVMPYVLVGILLIAPYLFYGNQEKRYPAYERRPDTSKLVIGSDLSVYNDFEIGGPFIDEKLSRYWIGRLNYYQSAEKIFETLDKSAPDIIEDEWNVLDSVFTRLPLLERNYTMDGNRYLRNSETLTP